MSENTEKRVMKITGSMGTSKLQDLVEKLRDEGLSFGDATKRVYELWTQDAIDLREH